MNTNRAMSYSDIVTLINDTLDASRNVLDELHNYTDYLIDQHGWNETFNKSHPCVHFEPNMEMEAQFRQTMSFPISHFVKAQVLLLIETIELNDDKHTSNLLGVAKELIDFLIVVTNKE